MARRSSELLNRLPSVSELLEKPPIKDLVKQFNHSTVATGVRSYLEQLHGELQDRLAQSSLPSPGELAERAARYVLGPFRQRPCIVVNATGRLHGHQWATVPLAPRAQAALVATAGGYSLRSTQMASTALEASQLVCRHSGAEAAVVVHSYPGAVWLALASLAAERRVVAARGQLGQIDGGSPASLIASTRVSLVEVGAANSAVVADYEAAIDDDTAALLCVRSDGYQIVGETKWASREELVALARDRDLILIEALDGAALDPKRLSSADIALDACHAAATSLAEGADLVIVRGAGLVGGPECGLILGRRELVELISFHPLFAAWQIDALRLAALVETLRLGDGHGNDDHPDLPLLRILATRVENLKNRAERLADQLRDNPRLAAVEAIPLAGEIPRGDSPYDRVPSYGVALVPAGERLDDLVELLGSAAQPVVGRLEGNRLILDLRTVFPDQDQLIVTAITAEQSETSGDSSDTGQEAATNGEDPG